MPQATFAKASGRAICSFGGLAQPNGQGVLANIDLNDFVSWFLQDDSLGDFGPTLALGQFMWRGKGTFLGQDFPIRQIRLPMEYRESVATLGSALARLEMAGEQLLSFDSLTAIRARYQGITNRQVLVGWNWSGPRRTAFDLVFACPEPWFRDIATTNLATINVVNAPTAAPSGAVAAGGALATGTYTLQYTYVTASGETAASPVSSNIVLTTGNQQISVSAVTPLPAFATAVKWYFASGPTTGFTVQNSGGAFTLNTAGNSVAPPTSTPATQFSIAYGGSVFCEPVFTLTIPGSNAGVITTATLTNALSGEGLTAQFGGLAALTAYTITIDSGAMTIVDGSGKAYDNTGNSFPNLYGPAGQSNAFTLAVAVSSGLPSGLTFGGSWAPRWEM